jgi:hypothetical protein
MTSDVGSSHLLEFTFWALWVTAVLQNILSKDPKTGLLLRRRLLESAIDSVDTTTPVISIYMYTIYSVSQYQRLAAKVQ